VGQHGSGRRELFPAGQLLALDRAGARDPRDDPRIPVARRWAQQPPRRQAEEVMDAPLLAIENLRTYFYSRAKRASIRSVDGVSLDVARGETLGIVCESGSGKSVTALSAAGLVTAAPGVIGGRIELHSHRARRNLLDGLERYVRVKEHDGRVMAVEKDDRGWRRHAQALMEGVRGKEIAMIFQNPRSALNPYSTIGTQLVEAIRLHTSSKGESEAKERAIHWLERVRIDSPRPRFHNSPSA